jgi:hypothetical protein
MRDALLNDARVVRGRPQTAHTRENTNTPLAAALIELCNVDLVLGGH